MARRPRGVIVEADQAFTDNHEHEVAFHEELSLEQLEELEARLHYCHLPENQRRQADHILRGHVDPTQLPRLPAKTVRLFVTSTHTDFNLEKDALIKETFTELREYCRHAHGIDLLVIDPRWAQQEKSNEFHTNTELHTEELCRASSAYHAPHHLVLLGDRLGEPELPRCVPSPLYQVTYQCLLEAGHDVSCLQQWYWEDSNALPDGEFVLQPIHHILGRNWEDRQWRKIQRSIREQLMTGAGLALQQSLIEQDHVQVICGQPAALSEMMSSLSNPSTETICIFRSIKDMEPNTVASSAYLFTDLLPDSNKMDPDRKNQRIQIADLLCKKSQPKDSSLTSTVTWSKPAGIDESHKDHFQKVCRFVYSEAKAAVDSSMVVFQDNPKDILLEENIKHWNLASKLSGCVYGRDDILARIQDYILMKTNTPLILSGVCGQGKSTVIGAASLSTLYWLREQGHTVNISLIPRFCGLTDRSADIRSLLQDICLQIAYCTGNQIHKVPKKYNHMRKYIRNILQSGNFRGVLILYIDGVDQLYPADSVSKLDWLPYTFANNVKVILSASTHNNPQVLSNLRKRYPQGESVLALGELDVGESTDLLVDILEQNDRILTEKQFLMVRNAIMPTSTPLDVECLATVVKQWNSYVPTADVDLPATAVDCLKHILTNLENKYPRTFVEHALAYLVVSDGLSEAELYDVLSLDDEVLETLEIVNTSLRRFPPVYWVRLYGDLINFLSSKESDGSDVLVWRHAILKDVVEAKYCSDKNKVCYFHSILADFYQGRGSCVANPTLPRSSSAHRTRVRQVPVQQKEYGETHRVQHSECSVYGTKSNTYNRRKLRQLPKHLDGDNRKHELQEDVLFNYGWIQAKLEAQSLYSLFQDYELYGQNCPQASLVVQALKMAEPVLHTSPDQLSTELLSRLLHYYWENHWIRKLLYGADLIGNHICKLVPNWQSYHSPGSLLEYVHNISLEEYNSQTGIKNNRLHITVMERVDAFHLLCKKPSNGNLYIWDIPNALEISKYQTCKGASVYPSPDGERLNCFTDKGSLQIYDTHSSNITYEICHGKQGQYPSSVALSPRYTAFTLPGKPGPYIIDITAGSDLRKLTYQCNTMSFTSDSRMLAVHSGTTIHIIKMPLMERKCSADVGGTPTKLIFTDNHLELYVLTEQRVVKVVSINYTYKQCKVQELHCGNVDIHSIKLNNANNQLLVNALYSLVLFKEDHNNFQKTCIKAMPGETLEDQAKPFTHAGFSHDDELIIASKGRYVSIWNTIGHPLHNVTYTPSSITDMFISRLSGKVLTVHENKDIQFWNLDNIKSSTKFNNVVFHDRLSAAAAGISSQRIMCHAADSDHLTVYDIESNQVLRNLYIPDNDSQMNSSSSIGFTQNLKRKIQSLKVSDTGKLGLVTVNNSDRPGFVEEAWSMVHDSIIWDLDEGKHLVTCTNNRYTLLAPDDSKVIFFPCLEYDLSEPCLKIYNMLIFHLGEDKNKHYVEFPEGDICREPVLFKNGQYLAFVLCDSSQRTFLCLYSFEEKWRGVRYLDVKAIYGPHAKPDDRIIDVKIVADEQLVVLIGHQMKSMPYDEVGYLDLSQPIESTAVLYSFHLGTKVLVHEYLQNVSLDSCKAVFLQKNGVYCHEGKLWCARSGKLWKSFELDHTPTQNQVCMLLSKRYFAVVSPSRQAVWIFRTSNEQRETLIQVHGVIQSIHKLKNDRTLAVACTDGRVVTYTLTLGESDAMIDIIMQLPSRQQTKINTKLHIPKCGDVGIGQGSTIKWRDMMTQEKVNDFEKLTHEDLTDGNGTSAFLH